MKTFFGAFARGLGWGVGLLTAGALGITALAIVGLSPFIAIATR